MSANQKSIDWKFWLYWVLFSTLGYGIGGVLGWYTGLLMVVLLAFLAFEPLLYSPLAIAAAMALGGAVVGAVIGLIQWEAVRSKAPHASIKPWMTVNILGMAISWAILFGILEILTERLEKVGIWMDKPTEYTLWSVIAAGGLWGVLSASNLRHIFQRQTKHAALWLTLNSLCGMLVFAIGWIWIWVPYNDPSGHRDEFSVLAPLVPPILSIILWPMAGLLYGLITGTLLAWLLRESNHSGGIDGYVLAK